jgi:hypothetical protein
MTKLEAAQRMGAPEGDSPWHKMLPLGLAWGNDPGIKAVSDELGAAPERPLHETVIAKLAPKHGVRTLGWGGRMNGPIDNPLSSCMSCHQTSQVASFCGDGESPFDLSKSIPSNGLFAPKIAPDERLPWMETMHGGHFPEHVDSSGKHVPDPISDTNLSQAFDQKRLDAALADPKQKEHRAALSKVKLVGLDYSLQMQLALRRPGVTGKCFASPGASTTSP